MSLSSAVNWWEEWQLRILVLGSLTIQLFLAIVAPFRMWSGVLNFYRLAIWVSYLGGDALAIYALATLFNRQKKLQYSSPYSGNDAGIHDLEVLWAPILLMHLGGRMTISAYNIEDNELWLRHVGVAISQVTVTVYVFWTSLSPLADKKLLAAAIVLFILGIVRCFEKPLALKRARFNNLVTYFIPVKRTEITTDREVDLEQYIQDARDYYVQSSNNLNQQRQDPTAPTLEEAENWSHMEKLSIPDKLFVDYAYAYHARLEKLKSLRLLHPKMAFRALRRGLSRTFNLIYTKLWRSGDESRQLKPKCVDYLSVILLDITMTFPIASIVLFHISHKQAYRGSDIKVTYLLLYITYFSEIISVPARLAFLNVYATLLGVLGLPFTPSVSVDQHSLIGVLAAEKRWNYLGCITCLRYCGCQDFLQQHWFGRSYLYLRGVTITRLVIAHAEEGWMNHIKDVESYWKFSDSRGHCTLERNECQEMMILRDSLEKPLDESIILWHLATDFCFHCKGTSMDPEPAILCTTISNYMMYMLCANTEMLLPGTRASLFKDACRELDDILKDEDGEHLTEKVFSKAANWKKDSVLHDAWLLAQGLMQLPGDGGDDGKKMWTVIKGVWIEMLCFSAGRCRGYLHAKNLAYGGEFLTFVALLMSNTGLETLAERQQRMQLRIPKEERVRKAKMVTIQQATEAVVLP